MTKNYEEDAERIIEYVGGEKNVKSLIHCATRLRFSLADESLVKEAELQELPIVMKALSSSGQYQVVIGPKVDEVYDEAIRQLGYDKSTDDSEHNDPKPAKKQKWSNKLLSIISAIFTPYINILAAVGVLKGLVAILEMTHVVGTTSFIYVVLNILASGVFTLLPLFIAVTASDYFKVNRYTAIALAAALIFPLTSDTIPAAVSIGAISIPLKVYGGAVLPTVFAIYFLKYVEKFMKKIIPEIAAFVFVPTCALMISGIFTFLVIGPIANYLGIAIAHGYGWLYALSPVISGAMLSGFGQFFVIFGIHWGIIPLGQINVQVLGYDTIMAMFMSAVFGQFGAVVGSIVTAKNNKEREMSISASISAFFGITEPALYGVNVEKKYPFICGCIGAAVGGAITGLLGVKLYGFAPVLNVFMLGMFNGAQSKVIYEVIAISVAFTIGALLTIIVGKSKKYKQN